MTPDRIRTKGDAYGEAWQIVWGSPPSLHNKTLGVAHAIFENLAGDYWRGPDGLLDTPDDLRNWGSNILRLLNAEEFAVLAGAASALVELAGMELRFPRLVFTGASYLWESDDGKEHPLTAAELAVVTPLCPTIGKDREARARAAQEAIARTLELPDGEIHCDSRPTKAGSVPYFVWFARSPTHVAGAMRFIKIVTGVPGRPKPAKVVLESGSATERDYAAALYAQHYYLGTSTDDETNIRAYTKNLAAIVPTVRAALSAGSDTLPPPPAPPDVVLSEGAHGPTVLRLQQKIMKHDGQWGAITTAALKAKQKALGLPETGVLDEATKKKLGL